MSNSNGIKLDLRNAPDFRVRTLRLFVNASWILLGLSFILSCFTLPFLKIFFNYFLNLNMPVNLNPLLSLIFMGFITVTFLVSLIGVIFNITRNRRRSDQFNSSLMIISIISGISMIVWLAFL